MVELAAVAGAEGAYARHEHAELRAGLAHVHEAARALIRVPTGDAVRRLKPVCAFLTDELMPHVAWEGSVIFPEVEELSLTTWPTRLMRFDHIQINRAAVRVEKDIERICGVETSSEERRDAYDDLIVLETLIRAHLEREEMFVMPILEARNG